MNRLIYLNTTFNSSGSNGAKVITDAELLELIQLLESVAQFLTWHKDSSVSFVLELTAQSARRMAMFRDLEVP